MARALPIGVGLTLLVAWTVHASWELTSVPGTPVDVQISDAGHYAIATTTGYYEYVGDAGVRSAALATSKNAFVDNRGCLGVWASTGSAIQWADAACGTAYSPSGDLANRKQLRFTQSGSAFATAASGVSTTQVYFGASGPSTPLSRVFLLTELPVQADEKLSARLLGTTHYGVLGSAFKLNVVTSTADFRSHNSPISEYRELKLFGTTQLNVLAVRPTGGMDLVRNFADVIPPTALVYEAATVPGDVTEIYSAALHMGAGGSVAEGFGIAAAKTAASQKFITAVPRPGQEGALWVNQTPATAMPASVGPLSRVNCIDGRFCVALTNNPNASNVLVYRNDATPSVQAVAIPTLNEANTSGVTASVNVTDADGDAVFVVWEPIGTGYPLSVSLASTDGRTVTVTPDTTAPSLCAVTPRGFDYRVRASDGLAGHIGETTTTVNVVTTLQPMSSATFGLDAGYQRSTLGIVGNTGVSGVNCIDERDLSTNVTLTNLATTDAVSASFPAPGDWAITIPAGCNGGDIQVEADLIAPDSGVVKTAVGVVSTPRIDVEIVGFHGGFADAGAFGLAACGAGGEAELVAELGECKRAGVGWRQVSGPAASLSTTTTSGGVRIQTLATDLDSLVGQSVVLEAIADGGNGNVDTQQRTLTFLAEPRFVRISHSTPTPIAEEGSLLDVRVTLENVTVCPISAATYRETLGGMQYVPLSARLDGQPVAATVVDGVLEFPALSLAAGALRHLSYSARPEFLGEPRPRGTAYVRGVPVSEEAQGFDARTGCGCRSVDAALWGLPALLWWMRARRRRRCAARAARDRM